MRRLLAGMALALAIATATAMKQAEKKRSSASFSEEKEHNPHNNQDLEGGMPHLSYVASYEIVNEFPHDEHAFTQGLAMHDDGTMYESDGLYRQSCVRQVDISSGKTIRRVDNEANVFAEGIEVVNDRIVQLSWLNHELFEYDRSDLRLVRQLPLPIGREGWGLTWDGQTLYLTDSGSSLYHLTMSTYSKIRQVEIVDPKLGNKTIWGVNELEWVRGELWGNVYPMYQHKASQCIVRINATTGHVIGWIDGHGLLDRQRLRVTRDPFNLVLNGIAYHRPTSRIFVTGKMWDKMYEIKVKSTNLGPDHVIKVCSLG